MDQASQTKSVTTCQQILTDGHLCKCPALRTGVFCYYHQRDRQRLRIFQKARALKQMTDSKREGFRPLDELNTEIVESLVIPALDDKASIHVAFTNITRALYCDHISLAKARLMLRAVTEASLSLRRGPVLTPYFQPADLVDPEPIRALGDEDGCVLPEERLMKKAIVDIRLQNAERADQMARDIIAAAVARGEEPPNLPPRPLTPEEHKRNAIAAARAQLDRDLDDYLAQAEASGTLTDEQRAYFANQRRLREMETSAPPAVIQSAFSLARGIPEVIENSANINSPGMVINGPDPRLSADVSAQAGEPVPQVQTQGPSRQQKSAQDDKVESLGGAGLQSCTEDRREAPTAMDSSDPQEQDFSPAIPMSSEGHGFSRAERTPRAAPTALPKADVQREGAQWNGGVNKNAASRPHFQNDVHDVDLAKSQEPTAKSPRPAWQMPSRNTPAPDA